MRTLHLYWKRRAHSHHQTWVVMEMGRQNGIEIMLLRLPSQTVKSTRPSSPVESGSEAPEKVEAWVFLLAVTVKRHIFIFRYKLDWRRLLRLHWLQILRFNYLRKDQSQQEHCCEKATRRIMMRKKEGWKERGGRAVEATFFVIAGKWGHTLCERKST